MLRYKHVSLMLQRPVQRAYTTGSSGDNTDNEDDRLHPIKRTFRILGNDMRKVKDFFMPKDPIPQDFSKHAKVNSRFRGVTVQQNDEFQTHCDVLIVGGGGVGSSIAYWLKEKARDGLNVVVVEKDHTFAKSASRLSVCGLRQHFCLPENIEMSLFGADFIRDAKNYFGTDIALNYTPQGHLLLAGEESVEKLKYTSQIRNELGARNELLSPERLTARFPWLNTSGVALGCHGLEKEGWFDPWALMAGFRRTACKYGAHFIDGEVVDFVYQDQPDVSIVGSEASGEENYEGLDKALVKLSDGTKRTIKFALCVIAAGASSGKVAKLARIGNSTNMLSVPLPIVPRKRYVYTINTNSENVPGIAMPCISDLSGTFLRCDGLGGNYICVHNSDSSSELSTAASSSAYFETIIKPSLVQRVPAFESAKLVDSWAADMDYNTYDDSGFIGAHPYYNNLYIVTGFGSQVLQQTPALGRAISELIMDGQFRTIDLSRLSFDRLIMDRPMYEMNAI